MRDPCRKPLTVRTFRRPPLTSKGDGRRDFALLERLHVLDFESLRLAVVDPHPCDAHLGEARGETLELTLFPVGKGMIVTLGAVDPLSQKSPHRAAGELVAIEVAIRHGLRDEIGRRVSRPQSLVGDHLADNFVIRTIGVDLVRQPIGEAIAPKNDKLALVRTNHTPRQPRGKVIGKSAIADQLNCPAFESIGPAVGLEPANFFQRRNGAVQGEGESPQDLQLVSRRGKCETGLLPSPFEQGVDLTDDGAGVCEFVRLRGGRHRVDGAARRRRYQHRHAHDNQQRQNRGTGPVHRRSIP